MPLDDTAWAPSAINAIKTRRSQRRNNDQQMAALLIEGGVAPADVYVIADDEAVEDCVLSDDGQWAEQWGRPLRRWSGFASQAHAAQTRRALYYTAFAAQRGITDVCQIRISAPVCAVPLPHLRRMHAETSRKIYERLRYGITRYAHGLRVDLIAAEVVRDGPGRVYLHFHLVVRGAPAELAALRRYWLFTRTGTPNGWQWWDNGEEDADEDDCADQRHPAALVNYISKGLAAATLDDEWAPAELAELFRQTRGLALVRAKGQFACWLGDLDRAGLTVRRNTYGAAVIVPKRPAALGIRLHKEKLFKSVGFSILHRLDDYNFGDGILRRAWLVRGRAGLTIADLDDFYALGETPITAYAPIQESPPRAQPDDHQILAALPLPVLLPGPD